MLIQMESDTTIKVITYFVLYSVSLLLYMLLQGFEYLASVSSFLNQHGMNSELFAKISTCTYRKKQGKKWKKKHRQDILQDVQVTSCVFILFFVFRAYWGCCPSIFLTTRISAELLQEAGEKKRAIGVTCRAMGKQWRE